VGARRRGWAPGASGRGGAVPGLALRIAMAHAPRTVRPRGTGSPTRESISNFCDRL
jgi:hypothetical protein